MLFIHNDAVERLLTMKDCIEVQEAAFLAQETGRAIHRPRIDMYTPCDLPDGYWRFGTMEGWWEDVLAIRMKSDVCTWPEGRGGRIEQKHCVEPGTWCGLLMLFSSRNGEPLAFINDGVIQHMRVGGGAGLGVKHLARRNAETVGMLGSGGMAQVYLRAFAEVRPLKKVKVFSPTTANREAFAREMSATLGIAVEPVASAREAVRGVDILATCTDSMKGTIDPDWLEPGMHVANVGPFEISPEVEARFDVKIRQGSSGVSLPQGERIRSNIGMSPVAWIGGTPEEMKRLPPKPPGKGFSADYPDFCDMVLGRAPGRSSDDQITFYHNIGNQGLQFAAIGAHVLRKAREAGIGRAVPTEWFLQDIRD